MFKYILALSLLAAPASAATMTATVDAPSIVQVNEYFDITFTVTSLQSTYGYYSFYPGPNSGVVLDGDFIGAHAYSGGFSSHTFEIFYPVAGVHDINYRIDIQGFEYANCALTQSCDGRSIFNAGAVATGTFSVTAVPGPVVGTGLPGLVMAGLALLGWRRRAR